MLIDTPRLQLRPFEAQDLSSLAALLANPEFMTWSVQGPMNRSQASRRLQDFRTSYRTHGFSKWAVWTKKQPDLIGYCGLEMEVIDGCRVAELGYRIHPNYRRKGLATEAATASVQDAFERLRLPSVYAFVEPENQLSQRVLDRLGMKFKRRFNLKGREYLLYRLDRSQ